MMQQVDLLSNELKPRIEPLTVAQVVVAWGALAALLVLVSGWNAFELWRLADAEAAGKSQIEALAEANARLRAAVRTEPDPDLVTEVETLRALFQNQSLMVDAVQGYERVSESGFSGYLTDLAAQHVDGIALQRIEFHDGGSHILLSGETAKPIHVPEMLKRLSDGASFRGHRFNEFRLEAQESGLLRFDIVGPEPERSG